MKEFSFDNFKRWLGDQDHSELNIGPLPKNSVINTTVESRINIKRLSEEMEPEEGSKKALCLDFKENGGLIKEVNGNHYLVEVDSGTFYIDKKYVRSSSF